MTGPFLPAAPLASHGHGLWTEWGALEWAIVAVGGVISLWVIWLAVRHTFRPGEEAAEHVKRSILDAEDRALGAGPGAASAADAPAPPAPPPPPPTSSPRLPPPDSPPTRR